MSCHGDENNGDDNEDDGCYMSDYDDNDDYLYENGGDDDDDYLNMQAQFDNMDLPPGVEASVSWIKDTTSSINVSKDSWVPQSGSGSGAKTSVALYKQFKQFNIARKNIGSSSSTLHVGSSSDVKKEAAEQHGFMKNEAETEEDGIKNETEKEHDLMKKYESFKRFDTVNDFVDHHYSAVGFGGQQVLL